MVHCLTVAGRFFFVACFITQTTMFAQYPSVYLHSHWYNVLILLAVPTLVVWWLLLRKNNKQLQQLWMVWGCYILTMIIPMVGLIYGGLRKKLDGNHFFGPNVLMMTTCGSPAIALLLLSSANDTAQDNVALFAEICCNTILDLFDDIELLDMLLSQNESTFHLPSSLEVSILVCVCISLLLSTLEMAEKKHDRDCGCKYRKRIYFLRLLLQMFLVNIALLIIRLVVWLKYKHNASIFIAKNLIVIVMSIINMTRLGSDED
ncbi:uncharacterized protein LOC116295262 [Actinia tenebrosa]|uniref:Uncharacterized protein LOC116295262 n=1 Tax=Actinia tenebrosa TaxID=6105 RepID=A0A6P8HRA0_ACTTE|nr:uncharacterized protein LOC116295262 [Actinia tenebrosa]